MTALQNAFALFGMLAITYNAANALHEIGHVFGVSVGGGAASQITLNPFFWSRTYYSSNPSPMLAAWGGPIGGVVLGLAPAGILVLLGYQVPRLLAVLAVASLGVNGVYLTAEIAGNTGDGADLGESAARLLPKAVPVATGRSEMLAYVGAGVVVVLAEIAVFGR
ncbi:MAG: hypothetical protein ACYTKD_27315 [Planctomycetota bacterium]|jgi:hypothetical protein